VGCWQKRSLFHFYVLALQAPQTTWSIRRHYTPQVSNTRSLLCSFPYFSIDLPERSSSPACTSSIEYRLYFLNYSNNTPKPGAHPIGTRTQIEAECSSKTMKSQFFHYHLQHSHYPKTMDAHQPRCKLSTLHGSTAVSTCPRIYSTPAAAALINKRKPALTWFRPHYIARQAGSNLNS
jgi:hypothetical protein